MVKVKIYPACLKCYASRFMVTEEPMYPWECDDGHNAEVYCQYHKICNLIDGQEPIIAHLSL